MSPYTHEDPPQRGDLWWVAFLVAMLAAVLWWIGIGAPCATCSTLSQFIPLTFTVPDSGDVSIGSLACECANSARWWVPKNIYESPTNLVPPTPKHSGETQTVWTVMTSDPNAAFGWREGGCAFRVRCVNIFGDSSLAWSNYVVIGTALPDTNVSDGGRSWKHPSSGFAAFQRGVGDTVLAGPDGHGPIYTQEQYTLAIKPKLCEIFGYYCLRGARVADCGLMP